MDQYTSATTATDGSQPSVRSPTAVRTDNLIRRMLRVSNPNDPQEIADGLRRFFRGAAEQDRLEEQGLPFIPVQVVQTGVRREDGPAAAEFKQATDDVHRDVDSLLHQAVLKDIYPELRGWQSAIEGIIADGSGAARFALDPRQRDRTYAARRLLGDYARIARFLGAFTPYLNADYRSLAKSLDEVASVLLVMMGDALANIGFGGSRFLLQVPASELQERREAVLAALRNLNGSVQTSYDQSTWPWGLDALRTVLARLDRNGHAELRGMFQENTVAQLMEDLITRASITGADGLRALGSTAQLAVQRIRRLIQVIRFDITSLKWPPLAAYLDALQLFADGFEQTTSAFRLLYIARPPIVFYGLYGIGGPDPGTRTLIDLIINRGRLADLLDCITECGCDEPTLRLQVVLDKILYDLDRAIDYYSLGTAPQGDGEPEQRAATFGLIINTLFRWSNIANSSAQILTRQAQDLIDTLIAVSVNLLARFVPTFAQLTPQQIRDIIITGSPIVVLPAIAPVVREELFMQKDAELQWINLLRTMAPSCHNAELFLTADPIFEANPPANLSAGTRLSTGNLLEATRDGFGPYADATIVVPETVERSVETIADRIPRPRQ